MPTTTPTPLEQLLEVGQSPWYDNIERGMIKSGKLQALVAMGIRGVTVNPTIFGKAISAGAAYDEDIEQLLRAGTSPELIYQRLLIEDIRSAADVLRPVYDASGGVDGYVSIEVSPELAHDTQGSIAEARIFHNAVGRPNVMIKVPATDEGIPAIRQLTSEGINVNITLLFALKYHEKVMDAYIEGLQDLKSAGKPLAGIASVASFFVSRVDSAVDKQLDVLIENEDSETKRQALRELQGKAAIANARLAYMHFMRRFGGGQFLRLQADGARVQRLLWASTSTKNPKYRDVMYVEELIGPDTINTMPQATIDAFQAHGRVERTIDKGLDDAEATIFELERTGISMKEVTDQLQGDGIAAFSQAMEGIYSAISHKQTLLAGVRG